MLVPDCARAVAEVARVVRPGGRAVFGVWAESSRNLWMTAAGQMALTLGYVDPPDPDAPGPFRLAATGALWELAEAAGLERLHEEEVPVTWHAQSLEEWWECSVDLSRNLAALVARVAEDEVAAVRAGAGELLGEYLAADGSLRVPGVARVLVGWR
jgi:SAM-dependent methyltransferase